MPRLTGGRLMAAGRIVDENELRIAPLPATPLQFPSCHPQEPSGIRDDALNIVALFRDVIKPGAKLKHVEAFKIIHLERVKLEELVPTNFLPQSSWLKTSTSSEDSDSDSTTTSLDPLSNGRPAPPRKDFVELVKELSHDNGDAFRAARRVPPAPGRVSPRILHSRKVWSSIADMAEFWDTSLDRIVESNDNEDEEAMNVDQPQGVAEQSQMNDPGDEGKKIYMGRRISTGSKMPKSFREDTVSGFVEMVVWAYGCTLQEPLSPESHKVIIQGIPHTLPFFKSVFRMPEDRRKVRSGIREGPLMGVLCRHQTEFRKLDEPEGAGKGEIVDLLRESGILTLLAQKRARNGKEPELNPGKGKWWAEKPRFGGGKGGEFGGEEDEPVEKPAVVPGSSAPPKRSKRQTQERMWRAMHPPPTTWDKNVEYKCVGKAKGNDYDDVSVLFAYLHSPYIASGIADDPSLSIRISPGTKSRHNLFIINKKH